MTTRATVEFSSTGQLEQPRRRLPADVPGQIADRIAFLGHRRVVHLVAGDVRALVGLGNQQLARPHHAGQQGLEPGRRGQ
ncbi:MAG TPA: hypothetical protein VFH03_22685 [Actinoplanes sp.]|nr:hypothetical protein [Actinoplanes sp.]